MNLHNVVMRRWFGGGLGALALLAVGCSADIGGPMAGTGGQTTTHRGHHDHGGHHDHRRRHDHRGYATDRRHYDHRRGGGTPGEECTAPAPVPQRIVRLDYNKLANTLTSVLGAKALMGVVLPANVGNARQRDFQALFTEGNRVPTPKSWAAPSP